jgi:hypothetical protein
MPRPMEDSISGLPLLGVLVPWWLNCNVRVQMTCGLIQATDCPSRWTRPGLRGMRSRRCARICGCSDSPGRGWGGQWEDVQQSIEEAGSGSLRRRRQQESEGQRA